jgi:hypothetical protein
MDQKLMVGFIKPNFWATISFKLEDNFTVTGADPGFQVRGGGIKKIVPSGGGHEIFGGISCEKSRLYAKKSYFFQF